MSKRMEQIWIKMGKGHTQRFRNVAFTQDGMRKEPDIRRLPSKLDFSLVLEVWLRPWEHDKVDYEAFQDKFMRRLRYVTTPDRKCEKKMPAQARNYHEAPL